MDGRKGRNTLTRKDAESQDSANQRRQHFVGQAVSRSWRRGRALSNGRMRQATSDAKEANDDWRPILAAHADQHRGLRRRFDFVDCFFGLKATCGRKPQPIALEHGDCNSRQQQALVRQDSSPRFHKSLHNNQPRTRRTAAILRRTCSATQRLHGHLAIYVPRLRQRDAMLFSGEIDSSCQCRFATRCRWRRA